VLLSELLNKDPKCRPTVKKIIEKEFLNQRISNLLAKTVANSQS